MHGEVLVVGKHEIDAAADKLEVSLEFQGISCRIDAKERPRIHELELDIERSDPIGLEDTATFSGRERILNPGYYNRI